MNPIRNIKIAVDAAMTLAMLLLVSSGNSHL